MTTHSEETKLALMAQSIKTIELAIVRIEERLDKYEKHFVTHEEFAPIKAIVYGQVAIILTSFITGLIFLVFK